MSELTTIRVDTDGGVATVTLNRPEVHNAFNDTVVDEVTRTFFRLGDDPEVRVVVLTGEGKSFSAGADLSWMKSMVDYTAEENVRDARAMAEMFHSIDLCPKPVVGKIRGAAIGGGSGLVAASDIPIAAASTKFAFSEVRLGIVPAVISPFVMNKIGSAHARRYFVTGERFDAARAQEIGLISEAVPDEELDARVEQVVKAILAGGPQAVLAAKQLVFDVNDATDFEAVIGVTAEAIAARRASEEGQDGMRAFLEKRPARWTESS